MDFKEQISREAMQAISDKVFPGCVIGIINNKGERQVLPFGNFTYDPSSCTVDKDTMYDLASLTKSIPTASLALQLIDERRVRLEDKLIKHLPEFTNQDRELVLVKHLLTYTLDGYGLASAVDGADGTSLNKRSADTVMNTLLTHDFDKRPGTVFKYSNIPAALLGLMIEKITGSTLDRLANERFFLPLGMTRTTFFPEQFPHDEIPPTEIDEWRGLVQGIVHDESAYICKKEDKIVGHAGLFSTAPDILNFLEMLLHKGERGGKRYFGENIVRQMGTNQISELNDFTGLGWELNQERYMGQYCSPHTFGKTGFTGTLCVCDVEKGIVYVILSNRTFPKRSKDSSAINAFRKKIGEIILK
jgi:CubicO group peptidase (beta-lactamase class C family)